MTDRPGPAPVHPARLFALVPCAGVGQRAGAGGPKQYTKLAGRPVVAHTLAALAAVPGLTATLVVLAPDDQRFEAELPDFAGPGAWLARVGGSTRAASVAAGLAELRRRGAGDDDWVLVHDAARCLLRPAWVRRLVDACLDDEVGGLLALPVADTLKQAGAVAGGGVGVGNGGSEDSEGKEGRASPRAVRTLERSTTWAAQTPQMFRLALLQRALAQARAAGLHVTDESSAVEALGLAPRLVPGEIENLKLTWPADFELARRLLETR